MACDVFDAFATATQSLGMRILRYPNMDRPFFWKNLIPSGTYLKNTGVQQTTFTMAPSYPEDDPDEWTEIELSDVNGQPTPACDTNYVDVPLNMYDRLYNPTQVRVRGPIICREQLTFQHNIGAFLNGYVRELARNTAQRLEFKLRSIYMNFVPWYSFTGGTMVKYAGPGAQSSVGIPTSNLTQDMLDYVAVDLINTGVGTDENGWVMEGEEGKVFPLNIDQVASARVFNNTTARRQSAEYASMGKGADSDLSLWKAIGATRTIANERHVTTNIAPRFNNVGGVLTRVNPFKNADQITSDGTVLTGAYQAARYEAAIFMSPTVFTAEWVTPYNWQFPNPANYMGDWEFITGAERICDPAEYDPQHNKGRHFGKLEFAPRPDFPFQGAVVVYKRCPDDIGTTSCPSYT